MTSHFVVAAVLVFLCACAMAAGVAPKGKRVLQPFDFKGVTLDGGRMRVQFDEVRGYYLKIPIDDLLHGYRVRAGLPAPGKELGGWYTNDFGNVFPQILSGLARMYAATGDEAVFEKANAMLDGWEQCVAPDGYFFYSTHPTSRQYHYEKVVGALVDMYLYCGRKDALAYLSRVTDWAIPRLNRAREYANAVGDPASPLCDHSEWYTVSENLYRAYLITGDAKYRDFGEVWEYTKYWDLFAKKADIFGPGLVDSYHAYSHTNTFASASAAYLVTGESHYLDTLRNAYDFMQANEVYATGGYGPNEGLMPRERVIAMLRETDNTFETQCGSWAAFKMCKYLMSFTGDARCGDWVERLVLNGIGAGLPMSSSGQVTYYSSYRIGGASKELYGDGWSCCTGTRPQAIADYYDQVYMHDACGLYVNLYTPSTVRFRLSRAATTSQRTTPAPSPDITVTQRTRFPETTTSTFTVSVAQPTRFSLHLRAPGWLAGPIATTVNGWQVAVSTGANHWATVSRIWKNGDVLAVTLPAKLWVSRLDPSPSTLSRNPPRVAPLAPAALMYGPVVLAFRSLDGDPSTKVDLSDPSKLEGMFVPVPGEPLTYHFTADPNILVRPFYAFKQGERYYMYLGKER